MHAIQTFFTYACKFDSHKECEEQKLYRGQLGYYHYTRQRVQLQTNVFYIHERYNECSCQTARKVSSGTREETSLNAAGNVHQVYGHASAQFTHVERLRPRSETPPKCQRTTVKTEPICHLQNDKTETITSRKHSPRTT